MQGTDCLNCGATLTGRFCSACGQKRIEAAERRLSWFAHALVGSLLGVEGRLRRSIASFLRRPGELGAAWLAGQRVRFASPLALFLLINLVYFVAPPLTDFNLPLADQLLQAGYSAHARALVEARLAARGITMEAYAQAFELEAYSLAKLMVILHPLLLAPVLWLAHFRRGIYLVDHLAIALHLWAAALLAMMVIPPLVGTVAPALGASPALVQTLFKSGLLVAVAWYMGATLTRAYRQPVGLASLKTPLVFIGAAIGHLYLYRPALFYLAYAMS